MAIQLHPSGADLSNVGFIGLGLMGLPMARNLLARNPGMRLHIVNGHAAANAERLEADRVIQHGTPAELARQVRVCFTMLPMPEDVRMVVLDGPAALAGGLAPGRIVVDCSTSSAELARRMDEELAKRGCAAIDSPVSGAPTRAEAGTLSLMAGGRAEPYEQVRPLLECLGTPTYVGPPGAGQITKAVNQLNAALILAGVSEGLLLAQRAGVDLEAVLKAVGGGLGGSELMRTKGPNMIKDRFEPGFFLKYHLKDLNIVLDMAGELGLNLPFTELARDHLRRGVEMGLGQQDNSAVMKVLERG